MKETRFYKGEKVKNFYGDILTVMKHEGCQVFVYENCGESYHPTKLMKVSK